MWEAIFGGFESGTDNIYYWRWAMQHPYLFTLIKCSQPWLVAILLLVGSKILGFWFTNNKKG